MGSPGVPDLGVGIVNIPGDGGGFPPDAMLQEERYGEYKLALQHRNFDEADRVSGKYRFSEDEILRMNREVFDFFFSARNYSDAAKLAVRHGPQMEPEYQRVFQAWYTSRLLSGEDRFFSDINHPEEARPFRKV